MGKKSDARSETTSSEKVGVLKRIGNFVKEVKDVVKDSVTRKKDTEKADTVRKVDYEKLAGDNEQLKKYAEDDRQLRKKAEKEEEKIR